MLISDGINHVKLQSIIVGELKKAGLKHRLKKIILKSVKVSSRYVIVIEVFNGFVLLISVLVLGS